MVLADIGNIAGGAYKGWMNASGHNVDPTYLAYVLGSTATLAGIGEGIRTWRKNKNSMYRVVAVLKGMEFIERNPIIQGIKSSAIYVPLGALEIALGYGLGYVAQKITH